MPGVLRCGIVPLVGSVVGAVPGLLLALGQGGGAVLRAAALYLAVQQLESNTILPVVGQRTVEISSALLLFSVVAVGAVLGVGDVILAAPLTAVAFVLVRKLYVRRTLGNSIEVPGEQNPPPSDRCGRAFVRRGPATGQWLADAPLWTTAGALAAAAAVAFAGAGRLAVLLVLFAVAKTLAPPEARGYRGSVAAGGGVGAGVRRKRSSTQAGRRGAAAR